MRKIYFGLTGDKDDYLTASQTLLELGIEDQSIHLGRQDLKCKATVFGVSVTTLNTFELLWVFANKLKKSSAVYTDNLAVQTSLQHYKEFVMTVKGVPPGI